jgi:3-oxoacid CoA-transferase subunit A
MGSKVYATPASCLEDLREQGILFDGMMCMVGGFGLCGIPEQLIMALRDTGVSQLTCVSNNAGVDDWGLGLLLATKQIKKTISSYVGENEEFARQFLSNELEVEFNPQGTLAERVRAGGAGIPAFYTATGVGTQVAEGKETRIFATPNGGQEREFVMETGLFGDLALVKAAKADHFGNLVFHATARNFNPEMATGARFTIAEVDEIVETGAIDPDDIHLSGVYVDRVVQTVSEKRIEQRTISEG